MERRPDDMLSHYGFFAYSRPDPRGVESARHATPARWRHHHVGSELQLQRHGKRRKRVEICRSSFIAGDARCQHFDPADRRNRRRGVSRCPESRLWDRQFRTAVAPYAAIPHFIARTGEEDLPRRDYAFISYTPDAVFFYDHDDENAVNHDVRLAARKERDNWNTHGNFVSSA